MIPFRATESAAELLLVLSLSDVHFFRNEIDRRANFEEGIQIVEILDEI